MDRRNTPRVLLIEDDDDTAVLIRRSLEKYFKHDCVHVCPTLARALAVDLANVDLVLSDINLPDATDLDVLERLLVRRGDLPVVLLTGQTDLALALKAIEIGAFDYLLKTGDFLSTLPIVIQKNMAIWRTKQENIHLHDELNLTLDEVRIKNEQLQDAVRKLEAMASTDPLTGIANRRAFNKAIERRFSEAGRYDHDLACIMIDLDGFKLLNDTHGHQTGDQLLARTGQILEANCRRSDIAGRLGGDEFVILLPETELKTARIVAERVNEEFDYSVELMFKTFSPPVNVTMSIGLTSLRDSHASSPEQLLGFADRAMYGAKDAGKKRIMAYQPALAPQPLAVISA